MASISDIENALGTADSVSPKKYVSTIVFDPKFKLVDLDASDAANSAAVPASNFTGKSVSLPESKNIE